MIIRTIIDDPYSLSPSKDKQFPAVGCQVLYDKDCNPNGYLIIVITTEGEAGVKLPKTPITDRVYSQLIDKLKLTDSIVVTVEFQRLRSFSYVFQSENGITKTGVL